MHIYFVFAALLSILVGQSFQRKTATCGATANPNSWPGAICELFAKRKQLSRVISCKGEFSFSVSLCIYLQIAMFFLGLNPFVQAISSSQFIAKKPKSSSFFGLVGGSANRFQKNQLKNTLRGNHYGYAHYSYTVSVSVRGPDRQVQRCRAGAPSVGCSRYS